MDAENEQEASENMEEKNSRKEMYFQTNHKDTTGSVWAYKDRPDFTEEKKNGRGHY